MAAEIAELVSAISATPLQDYFKCPDLPAFGLSGNPSASSGFYRFGPDLTLYGRTLVPTCPSVGRHLSDASEHVRIQDNQVLLPFDIGEAANNLRYERYVESNQRWMEKSWVKDIYYRLR